MSNSRKNKSEKAKQVCEEMDANRRREGGGGAGGGGETRRVHVVYFLSRNGKTEQPHLIRVHHLNNNGVHLRGVKINNLIMYDKAIADFCVFDGVLMRIL
ncbi:hypothetical protein IEQ34_004750 [Dendrobium chrysotoxum]|uniref:SOSEKI DIX-like domain-containing protein n=1 Tax=Dendrobium chrysotoxum TaxID=161865 RepID=A0AAV7HGU4_DENCH|nr:hypothetical protein IEQ34_004750 [Dendrobium chrysotoxum]